MKLLNIPIEPIESRYSSQWDIWFKDQFSAYFVKYETIYGCATSGKISTGAFLDVMETNLYKTSQLLQIIEILRNYDDKERLVPGNFRAGIYVERNHRTFFDSTHVYLPEIHETRL